MRSLCLPGPCSAHNVSLSLLRPLGRHSSHLLPPPPHSYPTLALKLLLRLIVMYTCSSVRSRMYVWVQCLSELMELVRVGPWAPKVSTIFFWSFPFSSYNHDMPHFKIGLLKSQEFLRHFKIFISIQEFELRAYGRYAHWYSMTVRLPLVTSLNKFDSYHLKLKISKKTSNWLQTVSYTHLTLPTICSV